VPLPPGISSSIGVSGHASEASGARAHLSRRRYALIRSGERATQLGEGVMIRFRS